jgi:hypothetical protein
MTRPGRKPGRVAHPFAFFGTKVLPHLVPDSEADVDERKPTLARVNGRCSDAATSGSFVFNQVRVLGRCDYRCQHRIEMVDEKGRSRGCRGHHSPIFGAKFRISCLALARSEAPSGGHTDPSNECSNRCSRPPIHINELPARR